MELTRLLVYLLVGLIARASLAHAETAGVTEAISEEQLKVHEECRDPDYKKYVKCLMRPKRHHHAHVDGLPETDPVHCLETCLKKCGLEHDCDKKCSHCTKRTKHRHQIVTEYEISCESGDCNGSDGPKTTNITTSIGINNIINTHGFPPPVGNGNGNVTGNVSVYMPSLPLIPQISMVPQITYGMGGCVYSQWLCFQQIGTQQLQPPVRRPDCSVCGNPLLHHKCDVTFCYSGQVTSTGGGTSCKSPGCVGGST